MDKIYYHFTTKMEQAGVDDEYIQGWQMGYLGLTDREEQRVTETWSTGKRDGVEKNMENYTNFVR